MPVPRRLGQRRGGGLPELGMAGDVGRHGWASWAYDVIVSNMIFSLAARQPFPFESILCSLWRGLFYERLHGLTYGPEGLVQ